MIRSRADRDCFELSYASMNWIRFKGSPCRKDAFDGLSAPWRGSPSKVQNYYDSRRGVNAGLR